MIWYDMIWLIGSGWIYESFLTYSFASLRCGYGSPNDGLSFARNPDDSVVSSIRTLIPGRSRFLTSSPVGTCMHQLMLVLWSLGMRVIIIGQCVVYLLLVPPSKNGVSSAVRPTLPVRYDRNQTYDLELDKRRFYLHVQSILRLMISRIIMTWCYTTVFQKCISSQSYLPFSNHQMIYTSLSLKDIFGLLEKFTSDAAMHFPVTLLVVICSSITTTLSSVAPSPYQLLDRVELESRVNSGSVKKSGKWNCTPENRDMRREWYVSSPFQDWFYQKLMRHKAYSFQPREEEIHRRSTLP